MDGKAPVFSPRCPNHNPPRWLWPGYHCRQHRDLFIRYGITCEQYWALFEHQGGRCAVCKGQPGKWRLAVDHDHESGLVRGLAHVRCQRWITVAVVRYLADPPGRELSLIVPPRKLARLEARAEAKRERARSRAKARRTQATGQATTDPPSTLARLRAMTKQGA